jgi:hypothetical protein
MEDDLILSPDGPHVAFSRMVTLPGAEIWFSTCLGKNRGPAVGCFPGGA